LGIAEEVAKAEVIEPESGDEPKHDVSLPGAEVLVIFFPVPPSLQELTTVFINSKAIW
jgi:hypothetical protein